jgi:hypothetical protein
MMRKLAESSTRCVACGAGCIAKGNFTACGTSLTPDCVCKAQDPSPFIKCALDSCDAGGTANTINTFAINCGEFVSVAGGAWPHAHADTPTVRADTSQPAAVPVQQLCSCGLGLIGLGRGLDIIVCVLVLLLVKI